MSTRSQLETDLANARKRLDQAPADTPEELLDLWRVEYDRISFELNNFYDDRVSEFTD